jgi:hypothetical protein
MLRSVLRSESRYEKIDSTARLQSRLLPTVSLTIWLEKARGDLDNNKRLSPTTSLTGHRKAPPSRLRPSHHSPTPPRTLSNTSLLAERPRKWPLHPISSRPPPSSERTGTMAPSPRPAIKTHQSQNRTPSSKTKSTPRHHRPRRPNPLASLQPRAAQSRRATTRLRNGGTSYQALGGISAGVMSACAVQAAESAR